MITLLSAAQLYMKIERWLDGDRSLSLKQLNDIYYKIDAMLFWADDITADLSGSLQAMHGKLDTAYAQILAEVSA